MAAATPAADGKPKLSFHEAQRKARFGHRDWVGYCCRDGEYVTEPHSANAVKRAMLAVGTKGRFTILSASTGVPHAYGWRSGVTMLRNARLGR